MKINFYLILSKIVSELPSHWTWQTESTPGSIPTIHSDSQNHSRNFGWISKFTYLDLYLFLCYTVYQDPMVIFKNILKPFSAILPEAVFFNTIW